MIAVMKRDESCCVLKVSLDRKSELCADRAAAYQADTHH
jgi:hypothetical protein